MYKFRLNPKVPQIQWNLVAVLLLFASVLIAQNESDYIVTVEEASDIDLLVGDFGRGIDLQSMCEGNLLTNGGFENSLDLWQVERGVANLTSTAISGDQSIEITTDESNGEFQSVLIQDVPISILNTEYEVQYRFRQGSTTEGELEQRFSFLNADGDLLSLERRILSPEADGVITATSVRMLPSPEAVAIRVSFWVNSFSTTGDASIIVDDICVLPFGEPIEPINCTDNILLERSLSAPGWVKEGIVTTFENYTVQPALGRTARIQGYAIGSSRIFQDSPATSGAIYNLEGLARLAGGGVVGRLQLQFISANGDVLDQVIQEVAQLSWSKYTLSGTAPANSAIVRVRAVRDQIIADQSFFEVVGFCLTSDTGVGPDRIPDLVLSDFTLDDNDGVLEPGQVVNVNFTVTARDNDTPASIARTTLNTMFNILPEPVVEEIIIPALAKDESQQFTYQLIIPSDAPAGDYNFNVRLDPDNLLEEFSEVNNSGFASFDVNLSNLELTNISCPTTFPNREAFTATYQLTFRNNGAIATPATNVYMFQKATGRDRSNVPRLGEVALPAIPANETVTVDFVLNAENGITFPGFISSNGEVGRGDLFFSLTPFIIGTFFDEAQFNLGDVDLFCRQTMTDIAISLSADNLTYGEDNRIRYTVTVTNNGSEPAYNIESLVAFDEAPAGMILGTPNLSTGFIGTFNRSFPEPKTWFVASLAPGESETAEITYQIFTLDTPDATTETIEVSFTSPSLNDTNEANNQAELTFTKGNTGDICVLDFNITDFPQGRLVPGATISITADFTNVTGDALAASTFGLYQEVVENQELVGRRLVSELVDIPSFTANESQTLTFSLTLNDPFLIEPGTIVFNGGQTFFAANANANGRSEDSQWWDFCQSPRFISVDYPDVNLSLAYVNIEECYGNDLVVQTDLQLTNEGTETITTPIVVFLGTIDHIHINHSDITLDPTLESAYWIIENGLAPNESAVIERPFRGNPNENIFQGFPNIRPFSSALENQNSNIITNQITFEFDENCGGVIADLPDLSLRDLKVLSDGLAGDVVRYTVDVQNIGAVTVPGTYTIGAFLSTDDQLDSDDPLVGVIPTGNNGVGTEEDIPGAITVPNGTAVGTYFLILETDKDKEITESNENNNIVSATIDIVDECICPAVIDPVCGSDGVTYGNACLAACAGVTDYTSGPCTPTGDGIDLALTLTATNPNVGQYESSKFTLTLTNSGSATATGVAVDFFNPNTVLANGEQPIASEGTFNFFGDQIWRVGDLGAGESVTLNVNYFFLADPFLYAEVSKATGDDADSTPGNGNGQSAEEDDEAVFGGGVVGNDLPDLRPEKLTDETIILTVGESSTVSFEVFNDGAGASNAHKVSVYLTNPLFINNQRLIGSIRVEGQEAGSSQSVTVTVTVPDNLDPVLGYGIRFEVDTDEEIAETNEENNRIAEPVQLITDDLKLADLTLANLEVTAIAEQGSVVPYEVDVQNIGDKTAEGDYIIGAFLSTDNQLSNDDIEVGTIPTGNTPVGTIADVPGAITVPADLAVGEYFLILQTDKDNAIVESNESNNTVRAKIMITDGGTGVEGVDLELSLSAANPNVGVYTNTVFTLTLSNTGTETAKNIEVALPLPAGKIVLSGGTTPMIEQGTYNAFGDQVWKVGSLGAGQTVTLKIDLFFLVKPFVFAEVIAATGNDVDSTPNNGDGSTANEDDEAIFGGQVGQNCNIIVTVYSKTCDDNGTPDNPEDDTFGFKFKVTGRNVGSTFGVLSPINTFAPVPYGEELEVDNLPIKGGAVDIIVVDTDNESCRTTLSVQPPNTCSDGGANGDGIDLILTNEVDATQQQYTTFKVVYILENTGDETAENIVVATPLPANVTNSNSTVSTGDFNFFREEWSIPTLAPGEKATFTWTLFSLTKGSVKGYAQVIAASPDDIDSTPNNGNGSTASEDDETDYTIKAASLITTPSSYAKNDNFDKAKLYPTIAQEQVNITWKTEQEEWTDIAVYTLQGQLVIVNKTLTTNDLNQYSLNIADLAAGAYFIKIANQTLRFVKVK